MPTTQELVEAIRQAFSISTREEDEAEPYRNKYQAADLLKKVLGERALCEQEPTGPRAEGSHDQAQLADPALPMGTPGTTANSYETGSSPVAANGCSSSGSSGSNPASSQAPGTQETPTETDLPAAAAGIRCGLILLETDLLADGEASIMAGLPLLEKFPDAYLAWLLEAYNALGALYSDRGDMAVALRWLQRAEELYQQATRSGTKHAHLELPLPPPNPGATAGDSATATAAAAAVAGATASSGQQQATEQQQQQLAEMQTKPEEQLQPEQEQSELQPQHPMAEQEPGRPPGEQQEQQQPEAAVVSGSAAAATAAAAAATAGPERPVARPGDSAATEGEGACPGVAVVAAAETATSAEAATAAGDSLPALPEAPGERGLGSKAATGAAGGASVAEEGPSEAPAAPPLQDELPGNDSDAVQTQYTRTLYYLAQVHGHMKSSDRSALYCAATLYRQLASGKYDLDMWVNNCLQLGGYYAKVHAYALAMYCHAAAQAVVDRDTSRGAVLGEDIAANIELAAARVYTMRLAASHAKYVEGKELEMHYPDISYFPDFLRFKGLSVPSPDTFPWGLAALASTFEGARDLLNTGMPSFKEALSYYQLDGWVTDHVGILMDMSNMYRCLAGFEADPNRTAAMHRCRAQLLEPLSGALNPDHYPGLSRSIDLELAHVFREISDVRELQPGQATKAATAAATAARYYQRFLRSFASSDTGQMPDRVDADNEPYFLMASFGLGRMLHRMRGAPPAAIAAAIAAASGAGGGKVEPASAGLESLLVSAHKHLKWTSEYVKRHNLESWTREAEAAEELSELLVERMRLQAIAAARKGASG